MRRQATRPARGSVRQIWQSRRNGSTNHTCTGRCVAAAAPAEDEGVVADLQPLLAVVAATEAFSVSWIGRGSCVSLSLHYSQHLFPSNETECTVNAITEISSGMIKYKLVQQLGVLLMVTCS